MIARLSQFVVVGIGLLLFVGAMVYPAGAILVRAMGAGAAVEVDISWSLFSRSVLLAAGAAVFAVVFSLPSAYVIGRCGRRLVDAFTVAVLFSPVLLPAMVYAFGWERLLRIPAELRCVWVWGSWASPIAALLIGGGWLRLGRRTYEEALLCTGACRAFGFAVLPILRRHVVVGALVLFAFFLGEYSVPHACGLMVYATDLLSRAEASATPYEVLVASWPAVAAIAGTLLIAAAIWWSAPREDQSVDETLPSIGWAGRSIPVMVAVLCVVVPVWGLATVVPLWPSLVETVETYGVEVLVSLAVSLGAGVVVVFVGCCLVLCVRARVVVLAWGLLWAALPGALVGEAVLVAYLPVSVVYDHWPLMVLGYLARFGWVGILVAWLAQASVGRAQVLAARCDGASVVGATWRIGLASNVAMLIGGVLVVAALSLSEVATTALVRVPSVDPVSLILIEKFHRFEDGILVSLSLILVASAIPGAVLAGVAARRWR